MTKKSKARVKPQSKLNKQRQSDSSDDEEWPCLVCGETFAASRTHEKWVRTVQEVGARSMHAGERGFMCPNCDSGED